LADRTLSSKVQTDNNDLFSGRRTLLTLQKDNDLAWIKDWVEFHVRTQEVDAVLVYDNGSSRYGTDDLLECLRGVAGVEVAVVVVWPFLYGPQGGSGRPWDSDFCQAGMFEHARRRFLRHALAVVNADIDELIVSSSASVVSMAQGSRLGVVAYSGQWVEAVPRPDIERDGEWRHRDFIYASLAEDACPPKWTVVPARVPLAFQWRTHSLRGMPVWHRDTVKYRHFKGISTGWKYGRQVTAEAEKSLVADVALTEAYLRAGWS
jgi:hypothetical protein